MKDKNINQKQLTFAEKLIEADLTKFAETGEIKYYKSAKHTAETDNSPYILSYIKRELVKNPELALKIYICDRDFWNALKTLSSHSFTETIIYDAVAVIADRSDAESFADIYGLAKEKLFKYMFIGTTTEKIDPQAMKKRNLAIQIAMSYKKLEKAKTDKQVKEWEHEVEEAITNDKELAHAYHYYWMRIEKHYNSNKG